MTNSQFEFEFFQPNETWQDKVLDADFMWAKLENVLNGAGKKLPSTPRRPDVRMIVNNISGEEIEFRNPGDHSGSKPERIP